MKMGVGAVVADGKGRVLMLRRAKSREHAPGKWEFIGGEVEEGESPEEAVKREVCEEVGLEVEVVKELGRYEHEGKGGVWLGVLYACRAVGGKVRNAEPEKCSEVRWVRWDEVESLDLAEVVREDVRVVRERWPESVRL